MRVDLKGSRILLVDLGISVALLGTVQGLLKGAAAVHFAADGSTQGACAASRFSTHNADLEILCLTPNGLGQARQHLSQKTASGVKRPVILVLEAGGTEEIAELLPLVDDFIFAPIRECDLLPRLWRLLRHASASDGVPSRLKEKLGLKQIIGESPALLKEIEKLPAVARCGASVLLGGETGTGKEIFARSIHYLSHRSGQPFVPVNCGAIPGELVENELFGHEAGAFTSANSSARGVIQEAEGGTLFLDEVDSLPLSAQVKLLRFLQEREFRPLGAAKSSKSDVRVIAASNGNFDELLRSGKFRRDLFYRLNVISLLLPALRERAGDVPLLAEHFLKKFSAEFRTPLKSLALTAVQKLMLYGWPGNVRELENVIERAVVLSESTVISTEDLSLPMPETPDIGQGFRWLKARAVEQFERNYLQQLLIANDGNITQAARSARKNRRAFWELMRKHRITVQRPSFAN